MMQNCLGSQVGRNIPPWQWRQKRAWCLRTLLFL
jgi:hypothetical protein